MLLSECEDSEAAAALDGGPSAIEPEDITDDEALALAASQHGRGINLQAVISRRKGQNSQRNLSPLARNGGGLSSTTATGMDSKSKISPRSRKQVSSKYNGPPSHMLQRNKQRASNGSKKQFISTQTPVSTGGRQEDTKSNEEKQFGVVLPKVKKNTGAGERKEVMVRRDSGRLGNNGGSAFDNSGQGERRLVSDKLLGSLARLRQNGGYSDQSHRRQLQALTEKTSATGPKPPADERRKQLKLEGAARSAS